MGWRITALLSALLLVSRPTRAQSNAEVNAGVQFNFRPPGARSLAMGGAFVAVADDATAAYANPAGLGVLTRPEFSLEIRTSEFTTVFTDRGRDGTPTGVGVDTIEGLVDGRSATASTGPAFASIVYPTGRFVLALYLHGLSRYRASFSTQGAFFRDEFGSNSRAFQTRNQMRLEIVNYGLASCFRVSDDLWLGAGVSVFSFRIDSITDRFAAIGGFAAANYVPERLVNFQTQRGEDTAVDVNAGVMWRPSAKLQLGAVFRRGPEFEGVTVENRPGPLRFAFTPGRQVSGFKVPDAMAIGLALRPTDRLVLAAEAVRVRYSQRLDSFADAFGGYGEADPKDYAIDDGTEWHVGVEYVLGTARPLAFRAGTWREPDSRIRWVGPRPSGDASHILFREGKADLHGTFGLGWVPSARFQIDAGADLSDRSDVWTASAVLRF